ncbi:hypothetical protein ABZP36_024379 [Zizania latifolia]
MSARAAAAAAAATRARSRVLHAGSGNKNAFKALIAAEYSGVKVDLVKNFQMGVSNKTADFLKMNPIGKVPILETPEGPVFESNAIARYVTHHHSSVKSQPLPQSYRSGPTLDTGTSSPLISLDLLPPRGLQLCDPFTSLLENFNS